MAQSVRPPLFYRGNEIPGDLALWQGDRGQDNREQLERLRRNLGRCRSAELTQRQQEMLRLYYDEGKSMARIAEALQLNKSTVSRTIRRGRQRLERCLKYSL